MLITKEITIDYLRRGIPEPVEAVQCDANTRAVKVTLLNGGESWTPPAGAVASVAFKKPDGTAGWYDKLPDGSNACTVTDNSVMAVFAPQMLTAAGKVQAAVIFQDSKLNQLATFVFTVAVQANPAAGKGISNDYYNYTTMKAVNEAVDAALAELEEEKQDFLAKAEEALAAVHGAATADAPAIVCEASGSVISASDASDRLLQGLTLYGKTTQNGTPTPSNPVELVSVGAGGAIKATVGSTNLCDPNRFSDAAYYTVGEDGYITFTNTKTDKKYYSMSLPVPKGTYTAKVECAGGIEVYICKDTLDYSNQITQAKTITLTGVTKNIQIRVCVNANVTRKIRFTINAGSTATTYEPYKGQALTVSTPNGLPGIPVSSGGNYTDENGQAWICDEKDYARAVYVQRTNVWTADENAQFVQHALTNQDYFVCVATSSKLGASKEGFCNLLPVVKDAGESLKTSACLLIGTASNPLHFSVPTSIANSVSSFKKWAIDNSLCVVYTAKEPVEKPLPAEEMAAYYALHSNKPNTTAFNDAGAGMKLTYVADTKMYIDKKFGELAAALVNNN